MQIDPHLAYRADADLVVRKVRGGDLPVDDQALRRLGQGRNSAQCDGEQSSCAEHLLRIHESVPQVEESPFDLTGRMARYHAGQINTQLSTRRCPQAARTAIQIVATRAKTRARRRLIVPPRLLKQ